MNVVVIIAVVMAASAVLAVFALLLRIAEFFKSSETMLTDDEYVEVLDKEELQDLLNSLPKVKPRNKW